MEIKIPGVRKLRESIERSNPLWAATQEPCLAVITNDLLKALSQHATQKWDDNKAWSSQEWKADPPMGDRKGQPVVIPHRGARPQQFIIGNDETELDLSLGSRSFWDRVNDQVRKRQKKIFDECYRKRRKTFCDLLKVHVCNIGISSVRD